MKKISIVTTVFNEIENIEEFYNLIKNIRNSYSNYSFEHIIIDNNSQDGTVAVLERLASFDKDLKLIFNSKNFGFIRSFYHSLFQANGDAVITTVADFQEPNDIINNYIKLWEEGSEIILSRKIGSEENFLMKFIRSFFYKFINKIADIDLPVNTTGHGLISKRVVDELRKFNDKYPYFRGLVAETGFKIDFVDYKQKIRKKGKSKFKFYQLYDMAILGIVKHTRLPLRIATLTGFTASIISIIVSMFYLIYKILYWDTFVLGIAPLVVGLFAFLSIQIFIIGLIGEYVGAILIETRNIPLVVERKRINF